jgi:hypothetical protein
MIAPSIAQENGAGRNRGSGDPFADWRFSAKNSWIEAFFDKKQALLMST